MSFLGRWFKRGVTPPAPSEPVPSKNVSATLAEFLEEHGVVTQDEDGAIALPDHGFGAAAYLRLTSGGAHELEVRFALDDERVIVEYFAGVGEDAHAAEQDAWRNFVLGTFHVILQGVLLGGADDQVEVEEWVIGGARYRVVLGAAVCRNIHGKDLPEGWFPALQAAIEEAGVGKEELSWVRFFYGQLDGRATTEVMLNNHAWDEVAAVMSAFPWPKEEGYYSVRVFLTLASTSGNAGPLSREASRGSSGSKSS